MDPTDDNDDILDISFEDDDSESEAQSGQKPAEDETLEVTFDEETPSDTGADEDYHEPPAVCPNCGYDLMPLEAVCPRCGYDTRTAEAESASDDTLSAEADTDEPPPEDEQPIPAVVESGANHQPRQPQDQSTGPSGCSASPCLIVSGCLLAVILIVTAAVFFGARHLASQYGARLGGGEAQRQPTEQSSTEGPVTQLDESNFNTRVLQSRGWALVDFGADWCAPCRMLEPLYHELAAEYQGQIRFYSVDTEVSPRLGSRYVDRGIPTLVMFHNGRQVATKVGFGGDKTSLKNWIDQTIR